jgi:uncharacterized OB-fold protein
MSDGLAEASAQHGVEFVDERLVVDATAVAGSAAQLRATTCGACGRTEFPAIDGPCPACGASTEEHPLGPAAVLRGFTEVLHQPPGAAVEAPYTVAVGGFPEGVSVMGLFQPHTAVDQLAIGDAIEVCIAEIPGARTYAFRLASGG